MNFKKILFLMLLFLFLIPNIVNAADTQEATQTSMIEDEISIDYLSNGTLYSNSIHHRRPALGIAETRESRREKSLADNISLSFISNFRSRYVSHAVADSVGWVWQPSATIEWYGLGFNVWSNFVIEDSADRGTFNEVDLTI